MNARGQSSGTAPLGPKAVFQIVAIAAAAFHLSFASPRLSLFILVYLACLLELTRARSGRLAFYSGLVLGVLAFAPRLGFFYTIFGAATLPLWLVLAFWHALFVWVGQCVRVRFPNPKAILLLPILWTGFEYFRCELYPLKFSWLAPAFVFGPTRAAHFLGVYGTTFLLMSLCAALKLIPGKLRAAAVIAVPLLMIPLSITTTELRAGKTLKIAGIQLEFPVELDVPAKLDCLIHQHPEADIFVLSEYTFDGPPPRCVRAWCQRNSKYLIAGGKDPAPNGNFFNTAFVLGPNGEIIFKQVKAVPIQFFKDGLPAPEQNVWNSPWGKVGLCVCYDLSYTRVIDRLVREGAQIIINPTMDVIDWGEAQHKLHAQIPPMRAAEYGIPIFRLASSGVSQAVTSGGEVIASAGCGVEGATIGAELTLPSHGALPLDRILAPLAAGITLLLSVVAIWPRAKAKSSL